MKNISIIALTVVIAACANHPVRCRGALQPINAQAGPASISQPDLAQPASAQPDAANAKPAAAPSEPHQ